MMRAVRFMGVSGCWWARQDSNLQPDRYERPALTVELRALKGGRQRDILEAPAA